MSTSSRQFAVPAPAAQTAWPLSKTAITIICMLCPAVGGSFLYYAWREKSPEAARYANRISWLSFAVVFLVGGALGFVRARDKAAAAAASGAASHVHPQ